MVCTEDGNVYGFGNGKYGQLGHCNFEKKLTPTLLKTPLEGKCIVEVACGWTHSMALASDGCLYSWGRGKDGTLGHGSEERYCMPCVVQSLIGYKVVHIAARNASSVALVDPTLSYAMKMQSMINDETCSDVVFVLKNDERVYANKGVLSTQSEYFRAMFRSEMRESRENEVEVRDWSKEVFLLFLEHLYKGRVTFGCEDARELLALSDRYQVNDLRAQCLEVIKGGLSHTNVIGLLVEAESLGIDALKDVCIDYLVLYRKTVDKSKEALDILSPSLMLELLQKLA